jgi:hypothetical protein
VSATEPIGAALSGELLRGAIHAERRAESAQASRDALADGSLGDSLLVRDLPVLPVVQHVSDDRASLLPGQEAQRPLEAGRFD